MLIRSATRDDIPQILTIEREAGQASHWPEEKYTEIFDDPSSRRFVLVIECESRVQGFGVLHIVGRECEIENLAIAEAARRRGWGHELLCGFINFARKNAAETLFLEVRESNLAARKLYNKAGFVESGRRKRYYRDPVEDAILYNFTLAHSDDSSRG